MSSFLDCFGFAFSFVLAKCLLTPVSLSKGAVSSIALDPGLSDSSPTALLVSLSLKRFHGLSLNGDESALRLV